MKNNKKKTEYTFFLNQFRAKVNEYELNFNDKKKKFKYEIQLEGRQSGAWQVVKKYTALKAKNTVVFRVHPAKVGDIIYRAEVQTPGGVLTTNELVLHVTK